MKFYTESLFEKKNIIDRFKYRGKGRPRKSDYTNIIGIQRQLNKLRSDYLDSMIV